MALSMDKGAHTICVASFQQGSTGHAAILRYNIIFRYNINDPVNCQLSGRRPVSKFWTGRTAQGFTLIEVLVALTILSLSLAVIFSIFSVGLRGRRSAEEYEQATLLAESKLNSFGIDESIREGDTVGRFNDRFWWKTSVTPYHEIGRNEAKDLLRRPMQVTVTVFWGEAGAEKSVTLRTLRLVPK